MDIGYRIFVSALLTEPSVSDLIELRAMKYVLSFRGRFFWWGENTSRRKGEAYLYLKNRLVRLALGRTFMMRKYKIFYPVVFYILERIQNSREKLKSAIEASASLDNGLRGVNNI